MDEVILLSMRANAAHGNQNSVEDRVLMMNKLIQMDEKRFMNSPWEVSVKEVAAALQITTRQAETAATPKNDELKQQRDAAILELHKDGKSNNAIGKALGMAHTTVGRILERLGGVQNHAECFSTTQSSPSCLPLANTTDRPDTRVDADEFVDNFLSEYDDFITLAEDETESEPAPAFDLKAATSSPRFWTNWTCLRIA